ncbi:MAG: hypothetical protein COA69_00885 [Robiginitomaculum sp.]|nr:MAG: hypothetical protein COA69_00885 [Robiginitomaculum sp.]
MILSIVFGFVLILALFLPNGNFSSPVKIWTGAWAILWTVNGLLSFNFYLSAGLMWLVFFGNVTFIIGASFVRTPILPSFNIEQSNTERYVYKRFLSGSKFRYHIMYITCVLGWLFLNAGFLELGHSGGMLSIFRGGTRGFFEIMRVSKSSLFLGNEYAIPVGIKATSMAICITSILAGLEAASPSRRTRRHTLIFLAFFLPQIFLLSAGTGVRSFILIPGLLFGFSALATGVFLSGGRNVISLRMILTTMFIVLVFFVWVIIVQSARLKDTEFTQLSATLNHMRPWAAGYIPALSVWYDTRFDDAGIGFGVTFFRGILAPLGLVTGEGFNERITLTRIGDGQASNAMTIFRVIFLDFGRAGSVIFCFCAGLLSQLTFRKAIMCGGAWVALLGCVYCAVFFSINFWFFAYGSRLIGGALAVILVGVSVTIGGKKWHWKT